MDSHLILGEVEILLVTSIATETGDKRRPDVPSRLVTETFIQASLLPLKAMILYVSHTHDFNSNILTKRCSL